MKQEIDLQTGRVTRNHQFHWPFMFGKQFYVLWRKNGSTRPRPVANIICEEVHNPPPKGIRSVVFLDGDKTNFQAENVRWATPALRDLRKLRSGKIPPIEADNAEKYLSRETAIDEIARLRAKVDPDLTEILVIISSAKTVDELSKRLFDHGVTQLGDWITP